MPHNENENNDCPECDAKLPYRLIDFRTGVKVGGVYTRLHYTWKDGEPPKNFSVCRKSIDYQKRKQRVLSKDTLHHECLDCDMFGYLHQNGVAHCYECSKEAGEDSWPCQYAAATKETTDS